MSSNPSIPGLKCPECGESSSLHLRLEDGVVVCTECDEAFDIPRLEAAATSWIRLLNWLKSAKPAEDPLSEVL